MSANRSSYDAAAMLNRVEAAGLLDKVETNWIASERGKACAEILCPKCYSLMSPAKALIGPPPGITYEGDWPVKFRDCLKCHSCGHSEQESIEPIPHAVTFPEH